MLSKSDIQKSIQQRIKANMFEMNKKMQEISNDKKDQKANQSMKEEWNNFSRNRTMEMFTSGAGVDCVIEVQQSDGKEKVEFNVHKFVLMTNSDVFHAMFSHENTKESREGRIIITDSTPTAVRQMLHYMYAGALPKNYDVEKDSAALIKIADKYEIKPLMGFNEHKLIGSLSLTNVIDNLKLADLYQINALKAACGKMIRKNLAILRETNPLWTELKHTSPALLLSVLEQFGDEVDTTDDEDDDDEDDNNDDVIDIDVSDDFSPRRVVQFPWRKRARGVSPRVLH